MSTCVSGLKANHWMSVPPFDFFKAGSRQSMMDGTWL